MGFVRAGFRRDCGHRPRKSWSAGGAAADRSPRPHHPTTSISFTMGFDQNDNQPIVVPAKRTTKVNIGIIVGVLVFFVIGGLGIAWIWHHQDENAQNVRQNLSQPKSP
jgi:hypothetical protein